jgi:hypothetical protein
MMLIVIDTKASSSIFIDFEVKVKKKSFACLANGVIAINI